MDQEKLKDLARKYLKGEATQEEKQLLNQWYSAVHDDDEPEQVDARQAGSRQELKERMLHNIMKRKESKAHIVKMYPGGSARVSVFSRRMIGIAAAVVVLISVTVYLRLRQDQAVTQSSMQVVRVPSGKVMKLVLADGTHVWVNARSVFRYPRHFSGKLREVELVEGRAFFDVKHEAAHPFIVRTKSLNITVLGTSFDVRTEKEGATRVDVVTGKVGVTVPGQDKTVMLLPKQQVVLNRTSWQLTKGVTREAVVNLWCKEPLVFDQQNLASVFKAIEKQYNTQITVDNPKLLDEKISITLNNQPLDTIMEILSFTKHFNYQIANDSTVVIR